MRRRALPFALFAVIAGATAARPASAERADEPDLRHALDLIRTAPRDAAGFSALATWLFRHGDLARASSAAEEASRLDPASAAGHRFRGYIAAAADEVRAAEDAFRLAARLDPTSAVSLADFHLARAWAGYQDVLRRSPAEPAVLQRLRDVAATAEITPELKALVGDGRGAEGPLPLELAPAIHIDAGVAVVVEKSTQTVRLFTATGGGLALSKTYPCTTGQTAGAKQERGDRKTPDGVYVFADLLPGETLPNQYGALALPLNYPNAWDRAQGRSGHGIWFHGTDRLGSPFTPRDTQGCVIMRNDDLLELAGFVAPGATPVLIVERLESPAATAQWRREVGELAGSDGLPHAAVRGPEYTLILHRRGDAIEQEFVAGARPALVDRLAPPAAEDWEAKLRLVRPGFRATLLQVVVGGDPARVELHTSAPVRPRVFRPELENRLYVDLPGVSAGPVPESRAGAGVVERVRIAMARVDPPLTRLAIDLRQGVDHRVESSDGRVVLVFGP